MAGWLSNSDIERMCASAGIDLSQNSSIGNTELTRALATNKALFLKLTERVYQEDDASSEYHYFDGNERETLFLDMPCTDIEEVALMSADLGTLQLLNANDYRAYPLNSVEKVYLKRTIGVTSWGIVWYPMPSGVKVKAKWGNLLPEEVPECVAKMAALQLLGAGIMYKTGGIVQWSERGVSEEKTEIEPWRTTLRAWKSWCASVVAANARWADIVTVY